MGNKGFYTQVEYGQIRGYTMHKRMREYINTCFRVSLNKIPYNPYSIYLGECCVVFKILAIKYLVKSSDHRKLQLNTISWLLWDCKLSLLLQ